MLRFIKRGAPALPGRCAAAAKEYGAAPAVRLYRKFRHDHK